MTTDLEKLFFDTFGIEERCEFDKYCDDCKTCGCYHYPRITDRILLELICILSNQISYILAKYNIEELKKDILEYCITYADDIKHQVCRLFKENSNG